MKRRLFKGDLFDRTRNTLTLQYSGVLIAFLSLFVILVYVSLYVFIWNDQRTQLNELADREIHTLQAWADQDSDPNRRPPRSVEDAFSTSTDQSFYYLLADNGTLNLADEMQSELRPQVMAYISEGHFKGNGIEQATFQTYDNLSADELGHPNRSKDATFLVTHRVLYGNQVPIGTLYLGKEVTFQHDLFRWLLLLLIGMALVFFVLALWFSRLMSRKAMIPIAKAYTKQREFVADASHELRTPLSVLLASIEALQLEETIESDPFSKKVLLGMEAEVHAITKMAGELLQLARSDSNELVLDRSLFNLSAAAAGVIEKLRPFAQAKGIVLHLHAPDELNVQWDEERATQLLVLLLDNAVKYSSDPGGVHVTLTDDREHGTRIFTIEVKDSGIGIAAEALPRIFDRFYRQDSSRTRRTGGHGLGLAIAKNIVDAGGGTIQVESAVGEGSTFRVRIPW
ncbi:HAMP domain-containing histidine kinase [Tumebacillus sp. ITR2]|uniref:histidine kinase n=1 Tax=Tumebacillus amylolyticus TaxID=2801339 RepID=A0ABS1J4C7_9BACL|nr:HAMP domain-containing sensor histidine kinase [Tumebacillus amylolyticus]MBL0385137.1 HAMP domain-containing histidine kinase [Tumebacillus amylolyticus]